LDRGKHEEDLLGDGLALSLLLLGGGQALAATTRVVDDDGLATPSNCDATTPTFPTIGLAVTAAGPGDTIKVCPGNTRSRSRSPVLARTESR
jgi:hypothetical protein